MDTVFSRFTFTGKDFFFFSKWAPDHFSLSITDGKHAWSGEALNDYLENTLKPKGMELTEYLALARAALTTQDTTKKKFSYNIRAGATSSTIELVWKVHLADVGQDLSMKGTLLLEHQADGRPIIQEIFNYLNTKVKILEEENGETTRTNKLLETQRKDSLNLLSQLTIEKQCVETEMLSKFVEVLNEKKKKIRELKEMLKKGGPTLFPTETQESDDEAFTQSQLQTGESQSSLVSSGGVTFSLNRPTPSFDLLKGMSDDTVDPLIRKRLRVGPTNTEPQRPKGSTNGTMASNSPRGKRKRDSPHETPKKKHKRNLSSSEESPSHRSPATTPKLKRLSFGSGSPQTHTPLKSKKPQTSKLTRTKKHEELDDADDLISKMKY